MLFSALSSAAKLLPSASALVCVMPIALYGGAHVKLL